MIAGEELKLSSLLVDVIPRKVPGGRLKVEPGGLEACLRDPAAAEAEEVPPDIARRRVWQPLKPAFLELHWTYTSLRPSAKKCTYVLRRCLPHSRLFPRIHFHASLFCRHQATLGESQRIVSHSLWEETYLVCARHAHLTTARKISILVLLSSKPPRPAYARQCAMNIVSKSLPACC